SRGRNQPGDRNRRKPLPPLLRSAQKRQTEAARPGPRRSDRPHHRGTPPEGAGRVDRNAPQESLRQGFLMSTPKARASRGVIGITLGDPAGVGPEVIRAALASGRL